MGVRPNGGSVSPDVLSAQAAEPRDEERTSSQLVRASLFLLDSLLYQSFLAYCSPERNAECSRLARPFPDLNMPQWRGVLTSDLTEEGASQAVRFKTPLSALGRLASALPTETWNRRHRISKSLEFSTDRANRWCEVAEALLDAYKCKHQPVLSDLKKEIYHWLVQKYGVLSGALRSGEILRIDVLDAVVRCFALNHSLSKSFFPR